MPVMVRCTSAVRGSMKVSESPSALATMTDFSSGVRYRWCGSLPVGIRFFSVHVSGSITLTLPSSELRTNTGAGEAAWTADTQASQAHTANRAKIRKKTVTTGLSGSAPSLNGPLLGKLMRVISSSKTTVHGVALEVQHIAGPANQPTLVFLHEGLGSVALWRGWPQTLCERLGCPGLVYSRQGYGQSDTRPDVRGSGRLQPDYMHREALNVLPELLRLSGIERPVLLGHSDGGTIALLHAAHQPVSACIVMAPHVLVEDVSVRSIEAAREAYENGPLR